MMGMTEDERTKVGHALCVSSFFGLFCYCSIDDDEDLCSIACGHLHPHFKVVRSHFLFVQSNDILH